MTQIFSVNPVDLEAFSSSHVAEAIKSLGEEEVFEIDRTEAFRPCLERIRRLEEHLNRVIEGKEEIIHLILACTIAQVPMILLGPPGTAKSLLIRQFCALLGLRPHHESIHDFDRQLRELLQSENATMSLRPGSRPLFEYLVTRFTTPEEIIGPVNINALLRLSLFYREPEGMLPAAEIAFLDEIFKANSAILNSLLAIINERIYYNGGRVFDVNLVNVFGASNEPPDAEELAALYDRFPIRAVSRPVPDSRVDSLIDRALRLGYQQTLGASQDGQPAEPTEERRKKVIACVNDFRLLAKVVWVRFEGADQFRGTRLRSGSFSFSREFVNLFRQLRYEFNISDRTPERLVRVARSMALLEQKPNLGPEHLRVFKYCTPDMDSADALADVVEEYIAAL
jgi:MoxR-like ATPase